MALLHLTTADFDQTIGSGVTLVDFWATWCGPCQMLGPILEKQVEPALTGRAKVAKVDVDQARDLAIRFGIRSIPALLIFKDGALKQQLTGMQPADTIIKAVEAAI